MGEEKGFKYVTIKDRAIAYLIDVFLIYLFLQIIYLPGFQNHISEAATKSYLEHSGYAGTLDILTECNNYSKELSNLTIMYGKSQFDACLESYIREQGALDGDCKGIVEQVGNLNEKYDSIVHFNKISCSFGLGPNCGNTGYFVCPMLNKGIDNLRVQYSLLLLLLLYLAFAYLESSNYQGSVGKIMMKIKVVDKDGEKISYFKALIRNLIRFVPILIPFSILGILFDKERRSVHDGIVKSFVVKK